MSFAFGEERLRIGLAVRAVPTAPSSVVALSAAGLALERVFGPVVAVATEARPGAGTPPPGLDAVVEWDPAVVTPMLSTIGGLTVDRCRHAALAAVGLDDGPFVVRERADGGWVIEAGDAGTGVIESAVEPEWPGSWLSALVAGADRFEAATPAGGVVAAAMDRDRHDDALRWAAAAVDLTLAAVGEREPRRLRRWLADLVQQNETLSGAHAALRARYDEDLRVASRR